MSRLERFWPGIIMALVGQGCSASVQRGNTKNLPKRRSAKMLAFGWLVILLGVLAIQCADGRFPFAASL
jgi:hypothetical protein